MTSHNYSTADLVAVFNLVTGGNIKRFSDRTIGEARLRKALADRGYDDSAFADCMANPQAFAKNEAKMAALGAPGFARLRRSENAESIRSEVLADNATAREEVREKIMAANEAEKAKFAKPDADADVPAFVKKPFANRPKPEPAVVKSTPVALSGDVTGLLAAAGDKQAKAEVLAGDLAAKRAKKAAAPAPAPAAPVPAAPGAKPTTAEAKLQAMFDLLCQPEGATLAEVGEACGYARPANYVGWYPKEAGIVLRKQRQADGKFRFFGTRR